MTGSNIARIDRHPGRSAQSFGIARELGTDPTLIHEPSIGGVETKGDSQCYLGLSKRSMPFIRTLRAALALILASLRCGWYSQNSRLQPPTVFVTARLRCGIR